MKIQLWKTLWLMGWLMSPSTMAADSDSSEAVSFNQHIRPILNQHCVACHGGVKQAGDLSFVYGQDAAYVVEPGDPESSELIVRVTEQDPELRMPPPEHGSALSDDEVETLQAWIRAGAEWGQHWAFEPPRQQELPVSEDLSWSRQRVDHFVREVLDRQGLHPAEEARPERWLRRASLDLIGLPPSPRERRRFLRELKQDGESAYHSAVDRLLESSAFGERWASVWLDAVRYADSKGLGIDGRRSIWKYRDWVIRALNDDMPYDQFTIKQLAGDLLPNATLSDLVATACHRLTQTCEEGGTDDEQFRVEAVIDRVNTTMQTWQGLTFGCVQCHAHPYDPIRHEEYYQLLAFFNNTADCDLNNEAPLIQVPLDSSREAEAMQLDTQISVLQREQWQSGLSLLTQDDHWSSPIGLQASTNNSTKVVVVDVDEVPEYQTQGTVARGTTVVLEAELPDQWKQLTAIRFTGLPEQEDQARIDSEWGFVISHFKAELLSEDGQATELPVTWVHADEPEPILDPMLSLDPKNSNGFGPFSRMNYPRQAAFMLSEPVSLTPGSRLRVSLAQNVFLQSAFPLVAHRGRLEVSNDRAFTHWLASDERQQRSAEIAALKKQRSDIPSVATPVVKERFAGLARPAFVFDRGNYLNKRDQVAPSTPAFLPALGNETDGVVANEGVERESTVSRLELARWVANTDNPLTARVAVNRVWAQLFGIGLVETQEDFGSSGDPPSHPRLLDDLAYRFGSDMRWSLKTLLRELVLSATYRQSAVITPEKLEQDPRNRFLSRGPRGRLPAETIRDQTLAISGLLNREQFGAPVHPPIPEGVWQPFQGGDKWNTPAPGHPDRYRRTIYTYIKRTIQFPMLASFDAPTREFCSSRRLPSNTPLQALMAMNDALFVEASQALAQRMLDNRKRPRQQLRYGFLVATCRAPEPQELESLLQLYHSVTNEADTSPADANAIDGGEGAGGKGAESGDAASESATEPQEAADAAAQRAGLEAVAGVLLNLDEVLSK